MSRWATRSSATSARKSNARADLRPLIRRYRLDRAPEHLGQNTRTLRVASQLQRALNEMDVKVDNMRRNLAMSAGDTIAEPIYLLMAYYGFPEAYNHTRKLVAEVHRTGRPLNDLLWADEALHPFLEKLTENQREILRDSTNYIGASVQRTHATCDEWERRTQRLL